MKKTTSTAADKKPKDENPFVEHALLGEIQPDAKADTVIKVRVIGTPNGPRLDIRNYVKNERYEGFTGKGIMLPLDQVEELVDLLTVTNMSETLTHDFAAMVPKERAEKKPTAKAPSKKK